MGPVPSPKTALHKRGRSQTAPAKDASEPKSAAEQLPSPPRRPVKKPALADQERKYNSVTLPSPYESTSDESERRLVDL